MFGVEIHLCYINMDGTFSSYIDVSNVTFHGTLPTPNVTQIAVIPQGYVLMDRTVNTINITPEFSTYNLDLPTPVQGGARDFIIRAVAPAYYYSTPPTLSASGVTLMNAEGAMPEIATDENVAKTTLVYFSEIAANTFLVKGEALETIS